MSESLRRQEAQARRNLKKKQPNRSKRHRQRHIVERSHKREKIELSAITRRGWKQTINLIK